MLDTCICSFIMRQQPLALLQRYAGHAIASGCILVSNSLLENLAVFKA